MRCADIQPYKSRQPALSSQFYGKQQLTSTNLVCKLYIQAKKMKTAVIAGVCLLALTITTIDAVSKKQNCTPNLDLLACIDGFDINSETVCTDDCRTALTEYYDDCVPAGADAFRTGYALLCENIGCIPDLELKACLDGFTTNSETVCTDDCMTALTEYYDDCVSTGADAFKIAYALLCALGGSSATTVGATMFTTVSAVLVAVGN